MKYFFYTIVVFTELLLFSLLFFPEKIESIKNEGAGLFLGKIFIPVSKKNQETCLSQESKLACLLDVHGQPINSSCFVRENVLKEKIKKGLPNWAKQQIQSDLSKFQKITKADLDLVFLENTNPTPYKYNSIARFQVKNKKVKMTYANPNFIDGEVMSKKHGGASLVYILEYLSRNNYISDVDFIIALNDYYDPVNNKVVPIFTYAKSLDLPVEKDLILIPDWQNLGSSPNLRKKIKEASKKTSWHDKKDILFWRGGELDSTGFRKKFVSFAKKHPALIDAEFIRTYGEKKIKKFVTPEEHLQYKYLISIDGQRASWERLVWHLHSNSLVFKHESNQVQWFYKGIKPFVDYIPVTNEKSILQNIIWAEKHPKEVQSIISHSSNFVEENLSLEDMYHYMIVLLQEYNKKLVSQ